MPHLPSHRAMSLPMPPPVAEPGGAVLVGGSLRPVEELKTAMLRVSHCARTLVMEAGSVALRAAVGGVLWVVGCPTHCSWGQPVNGCAFFGAPLRRGRRASRRRAVHGGNLALAVIAQLKNRRFGLIWLRLPSCDRRCVEAAMGSRPSCLRRAVCFSSTGGGGVPGTDCSGCHRTCSSCSGRAAG